LHNVIIIGSGPAGLTAAIYTARGELKPLVIAGYEPGGQLITTSEVENFPGFPDGVSGIDLMTSMRTQAERFGATIIDDAVTAVDFSVNPLKVQVGKSIYESKSVIIATGATARKIGIPSEEALWGRGVSACATCDGFFFRDKKVVVVGGGDTALEEALFLTRFATSVTLIHRRSELRASRILQERAFANNKISFAWNSVVDEVLDTSLGKVNGVRLKDTVTGEKRVLACDGLFVAIGHKPNTELFADQVELTPQGYINAIDRTRTNVPGVFVAGDVQDIHYRQAITAAASGCMAAIDCEKWLAANAAE